MRLTAGERAALEEAAARVGLTAAAYVRAKCIGTPTDRASRRPTVERAALAQMLAQLGKCGSNLNQIARVLNSTASAPHDIPAALDDFRAACAAIMRALGKGAA